MPKAGDAGEKGGGPGDLYIFITVKDDPRFQRDGADLHHREMISFVKAALGGTIEVPTIDGNAELKVPAGTQPNTVLRMKEKGMPHLSSRAKGDLYVHVEVETPVNISKEQADLLKDFARMREERT